MKKKYIMSLFALAFLFLSWTGCKESETEYADRASYIDKVTPIRIGVNMLIVDADADVFMRLPEYDSSKAYLPGWDWDLAQIVHSGRDWWKDSQLCDSWYQTLNQVTTDREYVGHLLLLRKAVLALGKAAWHYHKFSRDKSESNWLVIHEAFEQAEAEWAEGIYLFAMLKELEEKNPAFFPLYDWSVTAWDQPDLWRKYYLDIR